MNKNRLIAIGDIHGEYDKLDNLIRKISPEKNDTIVFTGDYIDRGKKSKSVIDCLIRLSQKTNCIFLKGNHEELFLKSVETKSNNDLYCWMMSGGIETLESYDNDMVEMLKLHKKFFENLKPYYLTDKYLFVHAGINPEKPLNEQVEDDLLWIRDDFINKNHNLKQKIIFGHTPFDEPYIDDDKIGIDTGCGKFEDAKLTAFICDEEKFIQNDDIIPAD